MFKGEYKRYNTDGSPNVYSPGDRITYQGRIYLYQSASVSSPSEDPSSWIFTGETVPFNSSTAPIDPVPGQLWQNKDTAITYIYYYDGSSYQWVET